MRVAKQNTGHGSVEVEDYFVGPRDMAKHSKWPFFMQMHGSVLPKMILPLTVVAIWSTAITLICEIAKKRLVVDSLLLTVLGFVVAMAISFRTSSAYERYAEGRKYWSQLLFVGQNLARTIWVHSTEREGELGKEDLLAKLSALNMILSFATALKHKLRFEPGIDYDDMRDLVGYLDTFAKAAEPEIPRPQDMTKMKRLGNFLGVSFAESNPRKRIKRSKKPLGNLPLEILNHLSAYVDSIITNNTLGVSLYQNQAITSVVQLNEVMIGVERVLQTPLPIAYSIAISQTTWLYVMLLPFQLWNALGWVTIPGTIVAAYIILGIAAIGREIENPFGNDVNDLPLAAYCEELANDIDTITSTPAPNVQLFMKRNDNMMLWPLSEKGWDAWMKRDKQDIREALLTKTRADMAVRRSFNPERKESEDVEKAHLHSVQPQQTDA
jgi:predicted membrane chloride channel (bestrophin family)